MHKPPMIKVQVSPAAPRRDGVRLWADNSRLHYHAPKGVMTEVHDRFFVLGGHALLATQVRLHGKLDVAALRTALNEIVRRHEALRTCFVAAPGGSALRVIAREPPRRGDAVHDA